MTLTIAIIGLGQMGASYAKYASSIANKVICYDRDTNQSSTFKKRVLKDNNPFDVSNNISINIDKIEIVDTLNAVWEHKPTLTIVTTHKDSHCYYSSLAMRNNSHVLTEKPMCINLEEAEQLKQVSFMTQKKLFVGFSLHGTQAFLKLKELVYRNDPKLFKRYRVYRIGAVPENYMDRVSARFDLLSHDTDFCLQLFGMPKHTLVDEISARKCSKLWSYSEFEVQMEGFMPLTHPNGFEYGFELIYANQSKLMFSSKDLNHLILKDSDEKIMEIISLTTCSPCQKILEKAINSIINDDYDQYLLNELSIQNGVNCMSMLINDHKSGLDD
ncbi:Gfo/Idh/MocA family oxidoreductase [Legionella sp. km535]|uniref:Gfo/Idh/MocA family protein n=1 Tax=Legionella sp. km535 TaxID=2498107 RepID=UPI000F8E2601|nr:Gfo/Idh/MocA family oxidoreductase [Legionella sp. km535]RUR15033.1 Gfo/Idh/MocA family oxidoreductase [Legionella sp. km535]